MVGLVFFPFFCLVLLCCFSKLALKRSFANYTPTLATPKLQRSFARRIFALCPKPHISLEAWQLASDSVDNLRLTRKAEDSKRYWPFGFLFGEARKGQNPALPMTWKNTKATQGFDPYQNGLRSVINVHLTNLSFYVHSEQLLRAIQIC